MSREYKNRSTIENPCRHARMVAAYAFSEGWSRKAAISKCVEEGVGVTTAKAQIGEWFRAMENSDVVLSNVKLPKIVPKEDVPTTKEKMKEIYPSAPKSTTDKPCRVVDTLCDRLLTRGFNPGYVVYRAIKLGVNPNTAETRVCDWLDKHSSKKSV